MKCSGIYNATDIRIMIDALKSACEALKFAYPRGIDDAVRRQLARSILANVTSHQSAPMLLAPTS